MSPDEKKKLFDAIGYEGEDTSTSSYPEAVNFYNSYQLNKIVFLIFQYIDIDLDIRLKMLDVNIWSKINKTDLQ